MNVKIFLCEEHHAMLKYGGAIKGGTREFSSSFKECSEEFCNKKSEWCVTLRIPKKKDEKRIKDYFALAEIKEAYNNGEMNQEQYKRAIEAEMRFFETGEY